MTQIDPNVTYNQAVVLRIKAAVSAGAGDLVAILKYCDGADPRLVSKLYAEIFPGRPLGSTTEYLASVDPSDPRVLLSLPAPDPARAQWWFTSSTTQALSNRLNAIGSRSDDARFFCLGVPNVGHHLSHRRKFVDILDVDPDVVSAIPHQHECTASVYDAAKELPEQLRNRADVAIIDPPWYDSAIRTFICRALEALKEGGELISTFPPRLTRPGVEQERTRLINDIVAAGHELLSLEHNTVAYQVPRFELVALSQNIQFSGIPWRFGDLIHFRKLKGLIPNPNPLAPISIRSYSRNPQHFRVFATGGASLPETVATEVLENYSQNISTRAISESPDVWSTEKVGLRIGNAERIDYALTLWKDKKLTEEEVRDALTTKYDRHIASDILDRLNSSLQLWSSFADAPPLRNDEAIDEIKSRGLEKWATKASLRERPDPTDTFRGSFQRDRDRVLWSSSLRRLSNKTQLFPATYDDQLRQRLTHSIEVLQLATTIGNSFGLDRDLIEAGALAHDVGHTPFGHAGEHALHRLFEEIDDKLGGFNHYEHGVDVIRFLEGPYYVSSSTQFFGLNLTPEVLECILKHTYCQTGDIFSTDQLLRRSKHTKLIPPGYCHLEGQAVRVADKISYLISDLEDGLRLGILSGADLQSCQFFHRPPLDLIGHSDTSLYEQFLVQRRIVLKILMEDVLHATSNRLSRTTPQGIRNATDFIVNHSAEMLADVNDIWKKLQAGKLHKDRRVVAANLSAGRIVSELTLAFALLPDLLEEQFREQYSHLSASEYMQYYTGRVGQSIRVPKELFSNLALHTMIGKKLGPTSDVQVPTADLVMAKDYVAGLSDSRARTFHRDILAASSFG